MGGNPFAYHLLREQNHTETAGVLKILLRNEALSGIQDAGNSKQHRWREIHGSFRQMKSIKRRNMESAALANASILCTVLVLTNMASPEFLKIGCHEKFSFDAFCMGIQNYNLMLNDTDLQNGLFMYCAQRSVRSKGLCYKFIFTFSKELMSFHEICKARQMKTEIFQNVGQLLAKLDFLINAVSLPLPSIISVDPESPSKLFRFKYISILDKSLASFEIIQATNASGTILCWFESEAFSQPAHLYKCPVSKMFILNYFLCDRETDCTGNDTSDETQCKHLGLTTEPGRKRCSALLQLQRSGQCAKVVDYFSQLFVKQGQSIPFLTKHNSYPCFLGMMPCGYIHKKCFEITDICTYQLNGHGELFPCDDGKHLERCNVFECNGMFKCPQHYCIPWKYVCDAKWDCPGGVDEEFNNRCARNATCFGLFKCVFGRLICIHLKSICDNKTDCTFSEDETFCELMSVVCPPHCSCLAMAILCQNTTVSIGGLCYQFLKVSIDFSKVDQDVLFSFQKAIYLSLLNDNLTVLNIQHLSLSVTFLNLAQNRFTKLQFQYRYRLKVLLLQNNLLDSLQEAYFSFLDFLTLLNVSNNPIQHLSASVFSESANLLLVSLSNISPTTQGLEGFKVTSVKLLEVTEHSLCCLNHGIPCKVSQLWFESCEDLIPNITLLVLFLVLLSLVFLIPILSVLLQKYFSSNKLSFQVILYGFEGTKVTIGIHLIVIIFANYKFMDKYFLHIKQWTSGTPCSIGFGCSLWALQSSPLVLLLLSLARAKVVMSPMKTNFKFKNFTIKCVSGCLLSTLVKTMGVTLLVQLLSGALPHSLCSPFVENDVSFHLINLITIWLFVLDLVCSIGIVTLHVALVVSYKRSKQTISSNKEHPGEGKSLKIQLIVLSLSDFLLLAPSSVGFIILQHIPQYPPELPHYLTINLPLHSLVISSVFVAVLVSKRFC